MNIMLEYHGNSKVEPLKTRPVLARIGDLPITCFSGAPYHSGLL